MRFAPVLALSLLALACSDGTGPSIGLPVGTMSVWYDAPGAGGENSMHATGELSLDDGRVRASGFAAAGQNAKLPGKLTIVGFTPLAEDGSQNGRIFAVTIPAAGGARTVPILDGCAGPDCSATLFFNGVDADDPHREVDPRVDRACALTSGSVVITEHTERRVQGTFYGTGYCVFDNRTDPFTQFVVDSATFDAPIDLRYRPPIDIR